MNLTKLIQIASKKEKVILGLMSGTSIDGLDMALCRISGSGKETRFKLIHFTTDFYPQEIRNKLLEITSVKQIDTEELCIWHTYLAHIHASMISKACLEWNFDLSDIDLIASHGHTIYHAPQRKHKQQGKPNTTLQIGDGDHIAYKTGIITVSDFRQKDTARGGEGAPLAAYGDYLLFSHPQRDRILINLGGIANFTYLPANSVEYPPLSMDTGPASTLIDAAMRNWFNGTAYDDGGRIAKRGAVQQDVLRQLKNHPYFSQRYPKTTGPEMFSLSLLHDALKSTGNMDMKPEDIIATLTRLTSETLAEAILKEIKDLKHTEVFVSGGGTENTTMVEWMSDNMKGIPIKTTNELGLDSGAKEAALFAVLANEAITGDGELPTVGKISLP
ncbi:MAG: anhydro-N-acetylmuramic acid kinase [Balneolales bacterium]